MVLLQQMNDYCPPTQHLNHSDLLTLSSLLDLVLESVTLCGELWEDIVKMNLF
jgi:hypothetical protein